MCICACITICVGLPCYIVNLIQVLVYFILIYVTVGKRATCNNFAKSKHAALHGGVISFKI